MKRPVYIICILCSCFMACSSQTDENKTNNDTNQAPVVDQLSIGDAANPEKSENPQPANDAAQPADDAAQPEIVEVVDQPVLDACPERSEQNGDQCKCGDVSIKLSENYGWSCFGDFWRCLSNSSCVLNGNRYPLASDAKEDGVFCGEIKAIPNAEQYRCQNMLLPKNDYTYNDYHEAIGYGWGNMDRPEVPNAWFCNQEQCQCWDDVIHKDQFCTLDSTVCHRDNCLCAGKTIPISWQCKDGKIVCGGIEFDEVSGKCTIDGTWSAELEDSKKGITVIHNTMPSIIVSVQGKSFSASLLVSAKDGKFMCDDVSLPLDSLDKYQCSGSLSDFNERSAAWFCQAEDGCPCADTTCLNGQFCDGTQCYDEFESCEEGNCRCGDGACPKHGSCCEDNCYFVSNRSEGNSIIERHDPDQSDSFGYIDFEADRAPFADHTCDERRGEDLVISGNRYGEFTGIMTTAEDSRGSCEDSAELLCEKPEGCRTTDGRHYMQYSLGMTDEFHVDTGFVTQRKEWAGRTVCVLPRKDGLLRLRDAGENAEEFVCDEDKCACGKTACRFAEVCSHGTCRQSECQIPEKYFEQKCIPDADDGCIVHSADEPEYFDEDDDDDDDEKLGDTKESCSEQWSERYYDSESCQGGTIYIFDANGEPHLKEKVIDNQKPDQDLCSDTLKPKNSDGYRCSASEGWTCDEHEGCACGESTCGLGAVCRDDKCLCNGNEIKPGYLCGGVGFECHNPDGCQCNDVKCPDNATCYSSGCECGFVTLKDGNPSDYQCAEIDIDEYGEHQYQWKCINPNGCSCKDVKCPQNSYCDGGLCKCEDVTLTGGNPMDYQCAEKEFDRTERWRCTNPDGCLCGNKKCPQASVCEDGECQCADNPILDSKPFEYQCVERTFTFYNNGRRIESSDYDWKCTNPDGCTCGDKKCSEFALCYHNNCLCGGLILPDTGEYVCRGSDEKLRPICDIDAGCLCNGNKIEKGQSCIFKTCPKNTIAKGDKCYCGDVEMPNSKDVECVNGKVNVIDSIPLESDQECGNIICPKSSLCNKGKCLNSSNKEEMPIDDKGFLVENLMQLCTRKEGCECEGIGNQCKFGEYCFLGECESSGYAYQETAEYVTIHEGHDGGCDMEEIRYCAKLDGCSCGEHTCPALSNCENDECVYTPSDILDEATGEYVCHGTRKLRALSDDLNCLAEGWVCEGKKCLCGKTNCQSGEVCVSPDVCVPKVE